MTIRRELNLKNFLISIVVVILLTVPISIVLSEQHTSNLTVLNQVTPLGGNRNNSAMLAASGSAQTSVTPKRIPDNVLTYVPVTLSNSQSSKAPRLYNQRVIVDSNLYAKYESPTLQNVEWFTYNGTPIYSWIESGNSNTSSSTVFWLKIPFAIAGYSSATIFLGFSFTTDNLFSSYGHEGEAPTLSSSYAEYDNGALVFPFYDNFAGSSLNTSKWQVIKDGSGIYTVNNGITLSESAFTSEIHIVTLGTFSGIVDAKITGQNLGSYRGTGLELAKELPTTSGFQAGYRFFASDNHPFYSATGKGGFMYVTLSGSQTEIAYNSNYPPSAPYIMTVEWPNTGNEIWLNNYNSYMSSTDTSLLHVPPYVSLYAGSDGSNYGTISFQYVRVRSNLPSSVMPVSGFGSPISNTSGYAGNDAFYLTSGLFGNAKYPTPTNFLNQVSNRSKISNVTWTIDNIPYGDACTTNAVSLSSGTGFEVPDGLTYSLSESGISNTHGISIVVPIAVSGVTSTHNENPSFPLNISVWNEKVSVSLSGMTTTGYNNLHWGLRTTNNAGKNLTGLVGVGAPGALAPNCLTNGIDLASIALGTLAFIPGLDLLAVPALALSIVSAGVGYQPPVSSSKNVNELLKSSTSLYQNFSVDNGTMKVFQDPNTGRYTAPSSYSNIFTYEGLVTFFIGENNFNNHGKISIEAKNSLGIRQFGSYRGGAFTFLNISLLPAVTIYGIVNKLTGKNVPLLVTEIQPGHGAVARFYTKSNAYGYYRFFGEQGMKYRVQEILSTGLTAGNETTNAIPSNDVGAMWLNLTNEKSYLVKFSESGLPTGATFSVTFNGNTETTTAGSSLTFESTNGNYLFSVSTTSYNGYSWQPNPSSGTINVNGANVNEKILFPSYKVTFYESGLPTGATFSVTFNGNTVSISGSSISFVVPDGSYSYSVSTEFYDEYVWEPSPGSGTINVNGGNVNQQISFTGYFLGFF